MQLFMDYKGYDDDGNDVRPESLRALDYTSDCDGLPGMLSCRALPFNLYSFSLVPYSQFPHEEGFVFFTSRKRIPSPKELRRAWDKYRYSEEAEEEAGPFALCTLAECAHATYGRLNGFSCCYLDRAGFGPCYLEGEPSGCYRYTERRYY